MSKKRKIDFIIKEDEYSKVIFRFYPRQSSCHSFGDEPPKDQSDVYKVYYSYSIIKVWKEDNSHEILYRCSCDECSAIDEVAAVCKYLSEGKKQITRTYPSNLGGETVTIKLLNREIFPFGYGTSWTIKNSHDKKNYKFELFGWNDVGYRFWLSKKRIKEFGEYLEECCEHMLAHGDPI